MLETKTHRDFLIEYKGSIFLWTIIIAGIFKLCFMFYSWQGFFELISLGHLRCTPTAELLLGPAIAIAESFSLYLVLLLVFASCLLMLHVKVMKRALYEKGSSLRKYSYLPLVVLLVLMELYLCSVGFIASSGSGDYSASISPIPLESAVESALKSRAKESNPHWFMDHR
mgnify:CR=1 FL=1